MTPMVRVTSLKSRRDVVGLIGGLGNQLHQLAFARWLEERTARECWFDISYCPPGNPGLLHLDRLGPWVSLRLVRSSRHWPTPTERLGRPLRVLLGPRRIVCDFTSTGPEDIALDEPAWWFGCWQRAKYADVVLPDVSDALEVGDGLAREATIGIHVRRGDMLGTPGEVPAGWFKHAVGQLRADIGQTGNAPGVCVWSDDPDWCRMELDLGLPFEIAAPGPALQHLAALSRCRALVISRSTFSWWAARIATELGATVVYPSPWSTGAPELERAVVPQSWRALPMDVVRV
jgi:glycosyl transferase family 11